MTKVNQQTMKTQYDGQYDTFCRKNHDYGNSFEESLDQFGIVASIVRMSDKMNRLESLTDESKTRQVGSESLLDTLEDLSNYAAMTACWLKGIREEDGENTVYADNKPVVTFSERLPMSQFKFLHREHEIVAMLEKVMEFNYKIEWNRMTEDECVELKEIMNRLGNMVTEGTISEELMLDLINDHVKFNPESTINRLFNQIKESQKNPNEDGENIDPENYVINMLSNIFRVVGMKMEKDEMLVPLDISDEAGLIAKCIIESNTKQEGVAFINKYMCNHKDIPYELKDWIYGVIMRYLYYLEKEQTEAGSELSEAVKETVDMLKKVSKFYFKIEEFKMAEEDYKELDEIKNRLRSKIADGSISEALMRKLIAIHVKLNPDVILFQLFNRKDDTPATPTEVPEAIEKYWEEQKRLVGFLLANKVSIPDDVMEDLKDPVEEKEGVGDNILKAIIWLLPLNKEY